MISIIYIWLFSFAQDGVPFKPDAEFELKMDYQFKTRTANQYRVDFTEPSQSRSGPLPHLTLLLKVLKVGKDETRLRITNNLGEQMINRKLKEGLVIQLEAGFTDDLKDRTGPHEFTVYFLSDKKDKLSKIVIRVERDGTFLVNEHVRGKL